MVLLVVGPGLLVGAGRGGEVLAPGLLEALLELEELPHEVEVGGDDGPSRLEHLVRFDHGETPVPHDVGNCDGWGAGDPRLAVHQDAPSALPRLLCNNTHLLTLLKQTMAASSLDARIGRLHICPS